MKLGPYELLSEIGRGAAGVVFRARGPTGQDVAIKVVRVDRRDALARFERERRLLSELGESEGFVPLLDAGEAPQGAFLVMPFVGGGTLRDRFARGLLGVDDAVSLARALAAAAGRAHERGIVHRDLKPENVLYTDDGRPLIADLGLAKHFLKDAPGGTLSVSFSREGEIRGTAGYMGPEQMSDARSAGAPTDVFAIGAILYECLAGRPAFLGENVVALLTRVANQPATPIRELRPETPAWLARVVDRSLAKNPGSRYQDGAALARALSEQGRGAHGRALGIAAAVSLALVLASGLLLAFSGEREGAKVVTNQAPTSGDRAKPIDPGLRGTSLEPLQDGVSPDDDTRQFDARAQREAALALEKKGSHEDALAAWFRVLDSTSAGNDGRREAMQHVRSLAGRVPPNREAARAAVFRVKVLMFTRTRFSWTDEQNVRSAVELTMSDSERRNIRSSVAALSAKVFELTRGNLRLACDERDDVVEVLEPVTGFTRMVETGLFFPYDWDLRYDYASKLPAEKYDCVLAYVLMGREGNEIPRSGNRFSSENGPEGRAFMVLPSYEAELRESSGERELHLFLSLMRGVFANVAGWPERFFPSPDLGPTEGASAGEEPCLRPVASEASASLAFSRHLMLEHATDRMWRTASLRAWRTNPWNRGDAHAWRVADPIPWEGKEGDGLAKATPFDGLDALPRKGTRIIEAGRRSLQLERVFPETNGKFVTLCQVWARVPRATSARLLIGSDDGALVRVNGGVVFRDARHRTLKLEEFTVPVELNEGWNRVVVKVENTGGAWGCSLRVTDPAGAVIRDLELAPDGPLPR